MNEIKITLGGTTMKPKQYSVLFIVVIICLVLVTTIVSCTPKDPTIGTNATIRDKPYSEELERRLANQLSNQTVGGVSERPDYLPKEMFVGIPPFPEDFYQVRTLVQLGRITDFKNLEEKYWQQPEFFPHFEDRGLPLLQNPPQGRWGAYGIASYPAETAATIVAGESLDMYFFLKSGYLVETYQGINLQPIWKNHAETSTGVELPDGSREVFQDPDVAAKHLSVNVDPNPFVLEPNFPFYRMNGTHKMKVTIGANEDTPEGMYIVALDTAGIPQEYEQRWTKKYLTLYTSGSLTKIDRPYFLAFVNVVRGEQQ